MRYLLVIGAVLLTLAVCGQVRDFEFLNITPSARVAAIGGSAVTSSGSDISLFFHNPALLDSAKSSDFYFMYNSYFAKTDRFSAAYHLDINKIGPIAVGIVYTNFGEFDRTDATGNLEGKFSAQDYVVQIGKSHRVGVFGLGANLKFAQSGIDSYRSSAILLDVGGVFRHPQQDLSVGMSIKNLGLVLASYSDADQQLPFDVEIGTTFKPQYMPVRFTITAKNFVRNADDDYRLEPEAEVDRVDQVFRYINIGTELILGKNVNVLLGYNHQRRQELRIAQGAFGAGFSYGFFLRLKAFELRFSRSVFHAAGGSNFVSLQGNFESVKKIF
ncbi:MAG: type IX secretion system protein PorQ [Cyclobacteriaceae bacterium]|nr:type IX secretion system protein PorQ [Cyclobacteriaceae bacterium HetDA_MAG_MS6]